MDYNLEVEQAKARRYEKINKKEFLSRFNHVDAINGWRNGELHTFVAGKGEGKSTLIRAWILEMLASGKKVFVRLSEEPAEDFRDALLSFMGKESAKLIDNLLIDSELDMHDEAEKNIDYKNIREGYINNLDYKIKEFGADVLIYDNFTTGILSRKKFLEEALAVELRTIAMVNDIPVIVAAHTAKGFKKITFANGDDIRGNMMLVNTAAYVLTLTTFWDHSPALAVLFWDKARNHTQANKSLYSIAFDKTLNTYTKDQELRIDDFFDKMRQAHKKRIGK
jgi:hypothetical protein